MKPWHILCLVITGLVIALYLDIGSRRMASVQRDLAKANTASEMSMSWPSLDGLTTVRTKYQAGETESEWQDRFNKEIKKARVEHPLVAPTISIQAEQLPKK